MIDKEQLKKRWAKDALKFLKGKTIASVRYLTEKEMEGNMWYKNPLLIIFTDGSWIYSMSDDEGNDGGAYATSDDNIHVIPII